MMAARLFLCKDGEKPRLIFAIMWKFWLGGGVNLRKIISFWDEILYNKVKCG